MDRIKFKVNGLEYSVGSDVCSDTMLLDYLRNYLQLRGTKYMCREGGCGACMVTASKCPGEPHVAINSCLTSIASCHGWDICTIEGLGNRKDGYHTIQKTMADGNATQCGYCSPGWNMMAYGILQSNTNLTMLDIEKSVSSNLCRCTGYRVILDALKKFGTDCPTEDRIMNVKEASYCKTSGNCCQSSNTAKEDGWCMVRQDDLHEDKMMKIDLKDGHTWYRPTTLAEVLTLLQEHSDERDGTEETGKSYMLVCGNTAKGAHPIDRYPDTLIDIHHLKELCVNELDQNLIVGAGNTMAEFMKILKARAKEDDLGYLSKLHEHMEMVAHIPLRNVATIAGNLMIKHSYNVFQSDVYLLLHTVGAQLTIMDNHGLQTVTMPEFLDLNMNGKVIVNVMFRPLSSSYKLFTYKLMPRAQSSPAIVNFGFLCKLNESEVVEEARICYGGLSEHFDCAVSTAAYLLGKPLFTNDTLQGALGVLNGEMVVDAHPPEPSVEYRRFIAKSLFYKAILTLCPKLPARYESAIIDLHHTRPCSSGKQTFTTDTSMWPMTQPMPKLEAMIQCSGEAQYTDDIPSCHNEVYAAFVHSTVAKGTILNMDASEALALKGVLAFYTYKDIPGLNSFTPSDSSVTPFNEEVLCEGIVKYHSQPIGIIVADTQALADRASKLIKVKYSNVTTPVTDIKVAKNDSTRCTLFAKVDATNPGTDTECKTITGCNVLYGQYHFPMETLVCVATPTEEGLKVRTSSQWLDGPHTMISRVLNIPQNKIDLHVRRVGGSYGLKITRSIQSIVACCLVSFKMKRTCRFIQSLISTMKSVGRRMPNCNDYTVTVNKSGVIQTLNNTIYEDNGHMINEPCIAYGYDVYYNVYDATKINYTACNVITDTFKNTFCRSPGSLEAISNIESIMERIAYALSMDPMTVRRNNLDTKKYGDIIELMDALETNCEYTTRKAEVDSFNTQNRWKKRGLRCSLCRWPPVGGIYDDVNLAVFHSDGSVVITHGGVEMGQGLNTKVAQVAAYSLKISLENIQIKENNTTIAPNSFVTGGSVTTDGIIIAVLRCIEQLLARLAPIKETLTDPTWLELITAAYAANVDLQVHGFVSNSDAQSYEIFGVACSLVEVDVLTGEFEILSVHILQDVGVSISPEIDIGQIEGAFMMGVGYWTCENQVIDPVTGAVLTNRTWNCHLGQARDIPQCFDITLRNSYSNARILGSKAVGEPPSCLSVVVPFALRAAIVQARQESGIPTTEWFDIDGPFSTEKICMATKTNTEDFKLT